MIKHAVIAAAGAGRRLGHRTPKCLIEIEGETLIGRQLALVSGVPDVRVVVGYEAETVIERVQAYRSDVTFIRNPRFRQTTTQDSYALGAIGLSARCLFMDADILFDPQSFCDLTDFAVSHRLVIGVTASKTDDAVFAVTRQTKTAELEVVSFCSDPAPLEWANVVYAHADIFQEGRGAVYEALQPMLPAPAKEIVSYEIDTERDLTRAREFARTLMVGLGSAARETRERRERGA